MISTRMPDDVVDKLKQLKDAETSSMGKIIYHTMFDNMQKAIDLNRPACQDTGEIMFFVKVGSRFPLLGELQSIDTKKHSGVEKFRTVYLFCRTFYDTVSSQS